MSNSPLRLLRGEEYDCRLKLFVDGLGKDARTLHLTTTYDLHGQTVCEVEKGINYVTMVLWV